MARYIITGHAPASTAIETISALAPVAPLDPTASPTPGRHWRINPSVARRLRKGFKHRYNSSFDPKRFEVMLQGLRLDDAVRMIARSWKGLKLSPPVAAEKSAVYISRFGVGYCALGKHPAGSLAKDLPRNSTPDYLVRLLKHWNFASEVAGVIAALNKIEDLRGLSDETVEFEETEQRVANLLTDTRKLHKHRYDYI